MTMLSFKAIVLKDQEKNATGIVVPPEIISQLGMGKRPKIKVTINQYTYRTTVGVMGKTFLIPLSAEHRSAANVQAGDELTITLEPDLEQRIVELPSDLESILRQYSGLFEKFGAVAYSRRKEYVRWIEEAKTTETRSRRLEKLVSELLDK